MRRQFRYRDVVRFTQQFTAINTVYSPLRLDVLSPRDNRRGKTAPVANLMCDARVEVIVGMRAASRVRGKGGDGEGEKEEG